MYGLVFRSGSQATSVCYSLETFRGVGFSSRVPGQREGRREGCGRDKGLVDGSTVVSGIRAGRQRGEGGGGFFFSFLPAKWEGRRATEGRVSYTAGAAASYMKYLYRGIFSKLIFDSHANLLHTWFLLDATLRGMMARFTRQPLSFSPSFLFPSLTFDQRRYRCSFRKDATRLSPQDCRGNVPIDNEILL